MRKNESERIHGRLLKLRRSLSNGDIKNIAVAPSNRTYNVVWWRVEEAMWIAREGMMDDLIRKSEAQEWSKP